MTGKKFTDWEQLMWLGNIQEGGRNEWDRGGGEEEQGQCREINENLKGKACREEKRNRKRYGFKI